MVEVSFYHLQAQPLEQVLPRLLEKVSERGLRALLRLKSIELSERLNTELWTYSAPSFLPHGSDQDENPEQQPILLTTDTASNPNSASVLVLLEDADAADIADFDRCLYMFDGNDPESLQLARARWKSFKAEGLEVTYWQQEQGRWVKKA
ncbi:DNA polymerase III subunit chi [Sneathiella glossodoripedis]|uniref:DNA polymerase III subunit chi n=1 Tax=Sneathiella glossodoripedis TaxID=418853 RepID=UPI000471F720|nr:DNA polymerase III subunit chi [Sneathiella glossodoripedis]